MIKKFKEFESTHYIKSNESFDSSYDKYLKDKEFMKYFNKVKNRILELFPDHNISNIDLLIDRIYTTYTEKYSVDDTINKLYRSANLYKFTTKGLDQ